jgi:hypothetical protein
MKMKSYRFADIDYFWLIIYTLTDVIKWHEAPKEGLVPLYGYQLGKEMINRN